MMIIEIVRAHLVAGGYDGLVCGAAECACELADLQPCGESMSECEPAYRGPLSGGDPVYRVTDAGQDLLVGRKTPNVGGNRQ